MVCVCAERAALSVRSGDPTALLLLLPRAHSPRPLHLALAPAHRGRAVRPNCRTAQGAGRRGHGRRSCFLVSRATSRETRGFNREKHGTNRESVALQCANLASLVATRDEGVAAGWQAAPLTAGKPWAIVECIAVSVLLLESGLRLASAGEDDPLQ
eukprot:SAG31_NODE_727_length_12536_cov_2.306022_8_plen_156_part_00